ncbi:tetratricopeptide repeat protein [Candidatus Riflebacteria bacterium]
MINLARQLLLTNNYSLFKAFPVLSFLLLTTTLFAFVNLEKESAKRFIYKGNYQGALNILLPLLRKEKEDSSLYSLIGQCYEKLRQPSQANKMFREAVRLDPENLSARRGLSRTSRRILKKAKEQIKAGTIPVKKLPIKKKIPPPIQVIPQKEPEIYIKAPSFQSPSLSFQQRLDKIEDLLSQKLYKEAENELKLFETIPQNLKGRVFYIESRLMFQNGQYLKSLETINEILQINPNYFPVYYLKGRIHEKLRDFPAAIKAYTNYLRYRPESPRVHWKLGELFTITRDYDRAIVHLEKAYKAFPSSNPIRNQLYNLKNARAQHYFRIGFAAYEDNNFVKALHNLNRAYQYKKGLNQVQLKKTIQMLQVARIQTKDKSIKKAIQVGRVKKFGEKYILQDDAHGYIENVKYEEIIADLKRYDDTLVRLEGVILKFYEDYGHKIALITQGRNDLMLTQSLSQYTLKDFKPNKKLSDQNIFMAFVEDITYDASVGDYVRIIGEVEPIFYGIINDHAERVEKPAIKAKVLIKKLRIPY